jgi:hypothetical protein
VAAKWAQVAAEVAKAADAGGALAGQPNLLAAIQSASEQTLKAHGFGFMGRARITVTLGIGGDGGDGGGEAAAAARALSPRRMAFTRIDPTAACGPAGGDPLSGLYVGHFGTCGREALLLRRGMWGDEAMGGPDGADYVTATKLTGDRAVPAGCPSFRARVSPSCRLPHADAYPPQLGVLARYPGQGLASLPGGRGPQWVPGELLLLDGGSGPERALCNGARLAFLWQVPDKRSFLIAFHSLTLPPPPP